MLRKILGTAGGCIVGMVLIEALLRAGQAWFPAAPGVDPADREAMAAAMRAAPAGTLLWTAFSWFLGALAGVYVAQRVARAPGERWPATTVEAFLLSLALLNLLTLKPPVWFWIVGLAAFPLAYALGIRLAQRARP